MLTDTKIKNAEIRDKAYKLSDGGGLFLQVNPNGSKYWRLKYRVAGKEKLEEEGSLDIYAPRNTKALPALQKTTRNL